MTTTAKRYTVKKRVQFGMFMGFVIYDTLNKVSLSYDFDEDEEYRANSKCDLKNALS